MTAVAKKIIDPVLDQEKLNFLISLGKTKPEFMPQLVDAFVKCSVEILEELKSVSDSEKVFHLGHKLKGMSGDIGAIKLEKIALEIEQSGQSGKTKTLPTLLKSAEETFESTRELLQSFL